MRLAANTTTPIGAPNHATGGYGAGSSDDGPTSPQRTNRGTAA
jgi:hypothetical protein